MSKLASPRLSKMSPKLEIQTSTFGSNDEVMIKPPQTSPSKVIFKNRAQIKKPSPIKTGHSVINQPVIDFLDTDITPSVYRPQTLNSENMGGSLKCPSDPSSPRKSLMEEMQDEFEDFKSPLKIRNSANKKSALTRQSKFLKAIVTDDDRLSLMISELEANRDHEDDANRKKIKDWNELSHEELINVAIPILQKDPEMRNTRDLLVLAKCIQNVEFFKEADKNTGVKCLKAIYHIAHRINNTVFEINSTGTTFWIILRGSVGVWVYQRRIIGLDDDGKEVTRDVLTEVRVLTAGASFGELALLDRKKRAATIICKEDCDFAVLNKEQFKSILKQSETRKLHNEIEYLASLPVFKTWSYNAVKNLYYNSPVQKYKRGFVLYNEGDAADKMYIVRTGELKVLKQAQTSDKKKGEDAWMKMKKVPMVKKLVEMGIIGEKGIIGEEELLLDCPRKYRVICHSLEVEVCEINRTTFFERVVKFAHTKEWLEKSINSKDKYYQQRLQDIKTSTEPINHLGVPKMPNTIPQSPQGSKNNLDDILDGDRTPGAGQPSLPYLDIRERSQEPEGGFSEYSKQNKMAWQKKVLTRINGRDILQMDLREEVKGKEIEKLKFSSKEKQDHENKKAKSPIRNNIHIPRLIKIEKPQPLSSINSSRLRDGSQQEGSFREKLETPKKNFHLPNPIFIQKTYDGNKNQVNSARNGSSLEKDSGFSFSGTVNTTREINQASLGVITNNKDRDAYGLENASRNKRLLENVVLSKTPHGAKRYEYSPEREMNSAASMKILNFPSALLYNQTIADEDDGSKNLKVVSARYLPGRQNNAFVKRMKEVDSSMPKISKATYNNKGLIVSGFNNDSHLQEKVSRPLWLERYNLGGLGGKMRSEPDLPHLKNKSASREPREAENNMPKNWFKLQDENRKNANKFSEKTKVIRE